MYQHPSQDLNARKRHWFLAVWSVPQVGSYMPASAYVWSDKRSLSIPQLSSAKEQRKLGEGAVLVNVAYVGYMTQYELTGTSPEPVPSVTTTAYNLGLEQALASLNPEQLVNAFPLNDDFNRAEWEAGIACGREMRTRITATISRPTVEELPTQGMHDVR
jgi:hypothetical protein